MSCPCNFCLDQKFMLICPTVTLFLVSVICHVAVLLVQPLINIVLSCISCTPLCYLLHLVIFHAVILLAQPWFRVSIPHTWQNIVEKPKWKKTKPLTIPCQLITLWILAPIFSISKLFSPLPVFILLCAKRLIKNIFQ